MMNDEWGWRIFRTQNGAENFKLFFVPFFVRLVSLW